MAGTGTFAETEKFLREVRERDKKRSRLRMFIGRMVETGTEPTEPIIGEYEPFKTGDPDKRELVATGIKVSSGRSDEIVQRFGTEVERRRFVRESVGKSLGRVDSAKKDRVSDREEVVKKLLQVQTEKDKLDREIKYMLTEYGVDPGNPARGLDRGKLGAMYREMSRRFLDSLARHARLVIEEKNLLHKEGGLAGDPENIAELIKDEVDEIVRTVSPTERDSCLREYIERLAEAQLEYFGYSPTEDEVRDFMKKYFYRGKGTSAKLIFPGPFFNEITVKYSIMFYLGDDPLSQRRRAERAMFDLIDEGVAPTEAFERIRANPAFIKLFPPTGSKKTPDIEQMQKELEAAALKIEITRPDSVESGLLDKVIKSEFISVPDQIDYMEAYLEENLEKDPAKLAHRVEQLSYLYNTIGDPKGKLRISELVRKVVESAGGILAENEDVESFKNVLEHLEKLKTAYPKDDFVRKAMDSYLNAYRLKRFGDIYHDIEDKMVNGGLTVGDLGIDAKGVITNPKGEIAKLLLNGEITPKQAELMYEALTKGIGRLSSLSKESLEKDHRFYIDNAIEAAKREIATAPDLSNWEKFAEKMRLDGVRELDSAMTDRLARMFNVFEKFRLQFMRLGISLSKIETYLYIVLMISGLGIGIGGGGLLGLAGSSYGLPILLLGGAVTVVSGKRFVSTGKVRYERALSLVRASEAIRKKAELTGRFLDTGVLATLLQDPSLTTSQIQVALRSRGMDPNLVQQLLDQGIADTLTSQVEELNDTLNS